MMTSRLKAPEANALNGLASLRAHGEDALGPDIWALLWRYGKVMSGAHAGQYVSGLPSLTAKELVDLLSAGAVIDVHLMHAHIAESSESSQLAMRRGRLVMFFSNRSEFALRDARLLPTCATRDV